MSADAHDAAETALDDSVDPRIARSRAGVLQAATELLVEGGTRAVTVDAVAERSGVAKSTMYRHFPSRTDLLVEVLRHNMPTAHPDVPSGTFEASLRSLLRRLAADLATPDWGRIFPALISLKHTNPDVHQLTETDRAHHLDQLRTVLDRGIAEGLVTPSTDVVATMNLLVGPLVLAVLNNDTDRLPRLVDEIADRYIASCHHTEPGAEER